ncbi:MAG TPA: hydantoinase B/oxoprolinase family protein, partial [Pirellulaceae bacterium]|nr:hydantoinase B/oxoprolinase family protein [Pirellulaceae bacterium]
MTDDRWQFWLDVGGTFTDCIARQPDGTLLRRKVLSSAVTKGQAESDPATRTLHDATRQEPPGFWIGYRVRLSGSEVAIADSRPGEIQVTTPLPERHGGHSLQNGGRSLQHYELVSPEDAPLLAIRLFLGLRLDEPIPPCVVRLGTTRGTNALLTRRGAKTALATTKGHADVLRIGYQNRPKLFELAIKKPPPLFAEVAEIDERIAADGSILLAPEPQQVQAELERLKAAGIESLAVCLLNAYANCVHEQLVGQIARDLGLTEISLSHQVSPLMKIVPRGDTTVVDAYLNPVLQQYVARLAAALPGSDVRLMTSAGGLASAGNFTGKDSILSGPAGGVVGFSKVAQAAGFERAIGFDMGGTSTDVSRFDGQYEYEYETEKAGVRIVAPMLAIETVAAGGGSICKWDGVKLVVGPDSAGADPGPACYGRGGPLTITDCNFYLGRILPEHFPFPLDRDAVEARLAEVAEAVRAGSSRNSMEGDSSRNATEGVPYSACALAEGFIRIANTHMAQAIRSISIAKGYDVRDYVLVAFGAAAPQHACGVASELGIRQILIHPDAGVLSALGIGLADIVKHRTAPIYRPCDRKGMASARRAVLELTQQVMDDLRAEGFHTGRAVIHHVLDLRYVGTDVPISIHFSDPRTNVIARFAEEHRRLYGYTHPSRPLEIVAIRVSATAYSESTLPESRPVSPVRVVPQAMLNLHHAGRLLNTELYFREQLSAGGRMEGPALIVEPLTTTIIDPGWSAEVLTGGELLLTADSSPPLLLSPSPTLASAELDPILLEVTGNHFTAIATQMGITLRNTAMSVNVKERLDFSCAIFTPEGDLVVNAPHIPVHLGAMSETVKQIIADNPAIQAGDVFVTNDPYRGGSHLPDVTVVTPVFCEGRPESPTIRNPQSAIRNPAPAFFTASRAHHAEIGGITPGSVPPFSKNLAEEGVLIRNFKLLDAGISRFDELRSLLSAGPYPSRSPETNLVDITAQLAANHQGAEDLRRMIQQYSLPVVEAYMRHIQDAAERKMRQAFAKMTPGRREFVDHLDDGTPICVAVTIHRETATIDFTGTGPVSKGNLNANRAIVSAAVMYVLRLLVGEDIPLNQGVLAPVTIVLPECILNPPERERPEDCP